MVPTIRDAGWRLLICEEPYWFEVCTVGHQKKTIVNIIGSVPGIPTLNNWEEMTKLWNSRAGIWPLKFEDPAKNKETSNIKDRHLASRNWTGIKKANNSDHHRLYLESICFDPDKAAFAVSYPSYKCYLTLARHGTGSLKWVPTLIQLLAWDPKHTS